MKKVVVIGGGSGLSTLLRGLRDYPIDITAIVTMTDDGASSGRLRKDMGVLPPGDIRKCIAALSENESVLTDLFEYRFKQGLGISGHSMGNLLITAMKEMTGNFEMAIVEISRLLDIKGRVLPATLQDVNLAADFDHNKKIVGESKITKYGYLHKIRKIYLTKKVTTNPRAIAAIDEADVIFVGPGSLYTSIIPNFLQEKLLKSFEDSDAYKVYCCNVSTERGETDNFSVEDHLTTIEKYGISPDAILINSYEFPMGSGDGYVSPVAEEGSEVKVSRIYSNIANIDNPLYHDSIKLGDAAWKIIGASAKYKKAGNGAIYQI